MSLGTPANRRVLSRREARGSSLRFSISASDVWMAIDRLAASKKWTSSGLAVRAGLDATTFNKSKRVREGGQWRWPSFESIAAILTVTDCTLVDFARIIEGGDVDTAPGDGSDV